MNDLVSVILPVYNSEETISRTIDSVLSQSYENIELLIIDDGSVDKSIKIIKDYMLKDNRVKLFHSSHLGAGAARNVGLNKAIGNYISFIDADDCYEKEFILNGLTSIIKHNADIAIYDYIRIFNNQKKVKNKVGVTMYNCYSACWNKIYKAYLWHDIRFPEDIVIEDFEVIPVIVGKAKKCVKVRDTYYYYWMTQSSITHSTNIKEELESKKAVQYLIDSLDSNNIAYDDIKLKMFVNDFLYWHLLAAMKKSANRKEKKYVGKEMSSYFLKDIKGKVYFSGSKKGILRRRLILCVLKLGWVDVGNFIANL